MARTAPLDLEREGWARGLKHIVGVDETGCGPLAGPVVAGAVVLYPGQRFDGASDSKQLSRRQRESLEKRIRAEALAVALGAASPREIERLNIRGATALAMGRALGHLPFRPDLLLVDGNRVPQLGDHVALVKGDRRCHSIACASILSKVARDRLMRRLDARYPAYGWAQNKGYGTRGHIAALAAYGPSPHHRRTFTPVIQWTLALEG